MAIRLAGMAWTIAADTLLDTAITINGGHHFKRQQLRRKTDAAQRHHSDADAARDVEFAVAGVTCPGCKRSFLAAGRAQVRMWRADRRENGRILVSGERFAGVVRKNKSTPLQGGLFRRMVARFASTNK